MSNNNMYPQLSPALKEISKQDIGFHYSSLTDYLDNVVNHENGMLKAIDNLINRYHLGAVGKLVDGHYGSVLPKIDRSGKIMGGNVLYFDVHDGTTIRAEKITDNLYHYSCYNYIVDKNVFFGENILSNRPVAVVQEEKTALLGALAGYNIDWLAVGYGDNLTSLMLQKLYGKLVVLFTDSLNNDWWKSQFSDKFKVDDSFVKRDINEYLINRIHNRGSPHYSTSMCYNTINSQSNK